MLDFLRKLREQQGIDSEEAVSKAAREVAYLAERSNDIPYIKAWARVLTYIAFSSTGTLDSWIKELHAGTQNSEDWDALLEKANQIITAEEKAMSEKHQAKLAEINARFEGLAKKLKQ